MVAPLAIGLLFKVGAEVVKAATPAIARYMTSQGYKKAVGAAARKPVSSTVTSIKQAQKLKPSTKVAGKKPVASTVSSAPKPKTTSGPAKPLRADPKQRINKPAPKKTPKDTGLKSAGTLVSAASLLAAIPRGEKKEAKAAKSTTGGMSAQSEARRKIARAEAKATGPKMTAAQKTAREKRLQADSRRSKAAEAAKSKSSGSKLSKFERAFADARKAGKKTFTFKNSAGNTNTYTTERKDKKPLPKKGKK
mgnify:FL=1